jgi:DNA-binding transcriptional ArsR family regulator
MLETSPGVKLCPNNECLKNATNIFILLKDLINTSNELSRKYSEELIVLEQTSLLEFENEEEINNMLRPLSNVLRLKILKNLSKGGKFYSQLEEAIGIKAGHLLFHIEKLIKAKYVKQEDKKYLITLNGLKALRFLHGLKEELSILI